MVGGWVGGGVGEGLGRDYSFVPVFMAVVAHWRSVGTLIWVH